MEATTFVTPRASQTTSKAGDILTVQYFASLVNDAVWCVNHDGPVLLVINAAIRLDIWLYAWCLGSNRVGYVVALAGVRGISFVEQLLPLLGSRTTPSKEEGCYQGSVTKLHFGLSVVSVGIESSDLSVMCFPSIFKFAVGH